MKLKQTMLLILAGVLTTSVWSQDIIINEFMAINGSVLADENGAYPDWIEIANVGSATVDLQGWYLSDSIASPMIHQLDGPAGTFEIPAGGFLVLFADGDTAAGPLHLGFRLGGGGEEIALSDDQGTLIDGVVFDQQFSDNSSALIDGAFVITNQPTPGAANQTFEDYSGLVRINEIMVRNDKVISDEFGRYVDWIELSNLSGGDLDMGGFFLSDDRADLGQFTIEGRGDTTVLAANEHYLLWADDSVELGLNHTNFKLGGSGETVYLSQIAAGGQLAIIDSVMYTVAYPGISYGRDSNDDWIFMAISTPNADNATNDQTDLSDLVVLNEIMVDNDSIHFDPAGGADDYIELFIPQSQQVDINGLFLTDTVGDLFKWRLGVKDNPGQMLHEDHVLIYADNEPEQGALHAEFRLGNSGEEVILTQVLPDGTTIQLDRYDYTTRVENVSFARTTDGAPEWQMQSCITPGSENKSAPAALAGKLFINEIMASNDNYGFDEALEFDDWVELYNATDESIDLSGLLLTDTLGELSKASLPCADDLVIGPHEVFILWADKQPEQGNNHINIGLSGAGEAFAISQLIDGEVVIIDSITFPIQYTDISYGRTPNGGAEIDYFADPTFNASNEPADVVAIVEQPLVKQQHMLLQSANGRLIDWQVFDLSGRQLQSIRSAALDMTDWAAGGYMIRAVSGQQVNHLKMVVAR